jgi:hypothetical protein
MQWLLVLAALIFAMGYLVSITILLRSARNYDDHMPDLEEIIGLESRKTPSISSQSESSHILST